MKLSQNNSEISSRTRVFVSFCVGLISAALVTAFGAPSLALITLFDVTAIVYGVWIWLDIWPMGPTGTAAHALKEDPSRAMSDIFLILASLTSLVAVGFLIEGAKNLSGPGELVMVGLGVISVIISWALVHTIFALRYARTYYGKPEGGIDFNQHEKPAYSDFAYLALTVGMTFQVSDTNFKTAAFRRIALRHALLSYLFGTIIVATTINLIAGLSK